MATDEPTPWAAVDAFLAFVLLPGAVTRADWPALARLLDALALARWSFATMDDGEGDDAPRRSDEELRPALGARFPEFGYYRSVAPLRDDGSLGFEDEPTLGDAIDDLLDIVHELQRASWYRRHRGEHAGAALLAWSFDVHWGQHLRDLQGYLHFLIRNSDRIDPRR
jgi:hypothetical protein